MSRRAAAHVVVPAAIMLAMIALFFSGVPALAALVAPTSNREFGLLEHLQLAGLGAVIALALRAARREESRPTRRVWAVVAAGAAFLFLEEIDYGLHYYELLVSLATGTPPVAVSAVRNIHNLGDNTDRMKLLADTLLGLVFVLIPFAPTRLLAPDSPLRPSRWYAATVGVMVVMAQIPHALVSAGYAPASLTANLSEFRELLIYYLLALYTHDVIRRRDSALRVRVESRPRKPQSSRETSTRRAA